MRGTVLNIAGEIPTTEIPIAAAAGKKVDRNWVSRQGNG